MVRVPSLVEFMERFSNDDACWHHLRRARWGEDGFTCPRCRNDTHWGFVRTRRLFQCNACGYQCSVTAGTILQDTKLSLRTWFLAAYLVLTMKKGISSHELARKLGVKQTTAWYLKQRLACVVRRRYGRDLFGLVEVDEAYLGGNRGQHRGGRHTTKAVVVGLVEDRDGSAGNLVLQHVDDASSTSIDPVLEAHIDKDHATVKTDGWRSYWALAEKGFDHDMHKLRDRTRAHEVLPWIHLVFSNLKRVMRGVHTKASKGQLQDYLDLFAYRFNHRTRLGDGLDAGLEGLVCTGPATRDELKAGELAVVY